MKEYTPSKKRAELREFTVVNLEKMKKLHIKT